jgi:hypothetical protein
MECLILFESLLQVGANPRHHHASRRMQLSGIQAESGFPPTTCGNDTAIRCFPNSLLSPPLLRNDLAIGQRNRAGGALRQIVIVRHHQNRLALRNEVLE